MAEKTFFNQTFTFVNHPDVPGRITCQNDGGTWSGNVSDEALIAIIKNILANLPADNWKAYIDDVEYNMVAESSTGDNYDSLQLTTDDKGLDIHLSEDRYDEKNSYVFVFNVDKNVSAFSSFTVGDHIVKLVANTLIPPKFVFGSHETGASIVDAIINNTPQTADLVKTFTIAEAVGAVFGSNDENNVHNIRDVYAKNVDNMAWVKGEIDPKTKGPGDRNWHPDETEDSSAEGEGSSSSRS